MVMCDVCMRRPGTARLSVRIDLAPQRQIIVRDLCGPCRAHCAAAIAAAEAAYAAAVAALQPAGS